LFIYAEALADFYNSTFSGCPEFYAYVGFPPDKQQDLCSDTNNTFNWYNDPDSGYLNTAIALLTCYFYENSFNIANANYYL
jgi:hypothetical protein